MPSINNICIAFDSSSDEVFLHMWDAHQWETRAYQGRAQNVLNFLFDRMKEKQIEFDDISAIGVVMGGPSFTSTRVMSVIANTIGFAHGIALKSLPVDFSEQSSEKKNVLWENALSVSQMIPLYHAEPNITLKKNV